MSNTQPDGPALIIRPMIGLKASGTTCLGSGGNCDRVLDHPLIAARHVEFSFGGGTPMLRDLGSGTFVNGQKIVGKSMPIQPGDQIDVGPYAFSFTGFQLEAVASMDYVQLTAIGVTHVVPDGRVDRTLLDKITLVFRPGEFVCLLGPSGCGKSTLMGALSGRVAPTSGDVRVNHRHLYPEFEALKNHIVLVPQQTVLHSGLTIRQALRFTARLRLPASTDRLKRVDSLIAAMKLEGQAKQGIWSLSGGQKKRLSLANELLSDPGLIFLDEVTSGLDPHIDADLMGQLKELAEQKRKTVICITHSVAHVADNCHQVVLLTEGGRLAFVGSPEQAVQFFGVDRLDQIYPMLSAEHADAVAARFANSPEYAAYLEERLPDEDHPRADAALTVKTPARHHTRSAALSAVGAVLYQTILLSWRHALLFSKDRAALWSLLGQIILVAMVLFLAFRAIGEFPKIEDADEKKGWDRVKNISDPDDRKRAMKAIPRSATFEKFRYVRRILDLTFLLAVVCFWFGCNNSAREIVRERSITTQEMYFNLRPLAYFLSKLLVLTLISWLQVCLLLTIIWYWCKPPEDAWRALPILLSLALAGTTLGLLISAVSSSERVAITLIPIAIIPQLILSGAIVQLTGHAAVVADTVVTTYWGKRGLDSLFPPREDVRRDAKEDKNKVDKKDEDKDPDEHAIDDRGTFARAKFIGLIEKPDDGAGWPLAIILLHAAAFAMLTVAALSADGTIVGIARKIGAWCAWFLPFRNRRGIPSAA